MLSNLKYAVFVTSVSLCMSVPALANENPNIAYASAAQLADVTETNSQANVAFVLRGYAGSTRFTDVADYRETAYEVMGHIKDLSFGKKSSFRLWNAGVDDRTPEYFQSLEDIKTLDAALNNWPGDKWSWVHTYQTDVWHYPTQEQKALIEEVKSWVIANQKPVSEWGALPGNMARYSPLHTYVLRLGGNASNAYLSGLHMPQGYKAEDYDITIIVLSSYSTFNLAGAQSTLSYFGIVGSDGSELNGRAAYVGYNTGSTMSKRTTVHEAVHAFGMGTHDNDPDQVYPEYSVMRQSGAINTLPVKDRINLSWLPPSTITTDPALITDLKGANDPDKKYLLEVSPNHYRELYDGTWYQYEDRNGSMYYEVADVEPPLENKVPVAKANGPYTAIVNNAISFSSAGSVDPDGSLASVHWNFGDGNTSELANPQHSYADTGNYNVTLTVTDNNGATAVSHSQATITPDISQPGQDQLINGHPISGLSSDQMLHYFMDVPAGATNLTFSINGANGDADLYTQYDSAPTLTTYKCRPYLNGSVETCQVANPAAGRWYVAINAYYAFSDVTIKGSFDDNVVINVEPVVNINGPYQGVNGQNIPFNSNGSTDSDGYIASYLWNFGDGTTSTQANPEHSYVDAGEFTVTLTVTDNAGAINSMTSQVTIVEARPYNELSNGTGLQEMSAEQGDFVHYYIDIPSGASDLTVDLHSGNGDGDLYLRYEEQPTESVYDCRPYVTGNVEQCIIEAPAAGRWYISVYAYNTYAGVSLITSYK